MFRITIVIFLLFIVASKVPAYNIPHVINIDRVQYKGDSKNWAVSQDERGVMYFGNDGGLLEFDGIQWKLNRTD